MRQLKFSDEQLEAINHFHGPALVIAGPGSGKTTVITNRIYNLINQKHIRPEEILVITFSKAAAISMQSRFNELEANQPVTFGTFHSVFYNIVRINSNDCNYKFATKSRRYNILIKILSNLSINGNNEPEFLDSILKRISYYKNSNYTKDNQELCNLNTKDFTNVYNQFCEFMRFEKLIDFDDMMVMCKELLERDEVVRKHYQNAFKFILIDEFQDINDLQFEIIKLLCGNEKNIFAVGDDDQSIYGFRGANPRIMFEFKDYFDAHIIKLSCNHRSTKRIVDASAKLICHNKSRFDKSIVSGNLDGQNVTYKGFSDLSLERSYICSEIKALSEKGNIALLFRNNISLSSFIECLAKSDISFKVNEKPYNPFDYSGFQDFLHYMKLGKSERIKAKDFIAVMNKPVRYINRDMINGEYVDLTLLMGLYKDKAYVVKEIKKLEKDISALSRMDMFSAFHYFRNICGYDKYLERNNGNFKIMDEIQNILKGIISLEELNQYVEKLESLTDNREQLTIESKGVYLMTFHASKGLEFDYVFIPGLMEGESPSSKSIGEQAIEEERRMLYVAMTRAKKSLTLTYLEDDKRHNKLHSRFLDDLME